VKLNIYSVNGKKSDHRRKCLTQMGNTDNSSLSILYDRKVNIYSSNGRTDDHSRKYLNHLDNQTTPACNTCTSLQTIKETAVRSEQA